LVRTSLIVDNAPRSSNGRIADVAPDARRRPALASIAMNAAPAARSELHAMRENSPGEAIDPIGSFTSLKAA